jgi:hypothetical protein
LWPVKADKAEEFERFAVDVVAAAVTQARPHLGSDWQLLRPETSENDVAWYAVTFHGGHSDDEWDLSSLMAAAFGPDRAAVYGKQLQSFLAADPRDYNFAGTITA